MPDARTLETRLPPAGETPSASQRRWAWTGTVVSAIYLLNPDFGVWELIPDVLPVIGNLDEVGATLLFVRCIKTIRRARSSRARGAS